MTNELLIKKMSHICDKLELYIKKKQIMGLDEKESERYSKLYVEYLELKLSLWDNIFVSYIIPNILYGEARNLYNELYAIIKWDGKLLVKQNDMDKIIANYNNADKEIVNNKFNKLYKLLKQNLEHYCLTIDMEAKSFLQEISDLLSNGNSNDITIITNFLDYKFEVIRILLEIKE